MRKNINMNTIKLKLKSDKGFTMQDVTVACVIFTIFVGLITMLMTYVYKTNIKTTLTSQMATYAVQILEDIDKISYVDAQKRTGSYYKSQFKIPAGFNVDLELTNYGENTEDVIKIVNLKITYTLQGDTTEYTVQRLKIKEI